MLRAVLSLALALWLSPQVAECPRFHPRENSSVEKSFELELRVRLTRLWIDEQDLTVPDASTIALRAAADLVDVYEHVDDGRPLSFTRRFRDIQLKWEEGGMREEVFGFHPLFGCTVRYRWQPGEKRYDLDMVEGRCPEAVLRACPEDFDLRGLLCDSELAPGASWVATGRPMLESLFAPARLACAEIPEDRKLEQLGREILVQPFLRLAERQAELRCTPLRCEDSNGSRLLPIKLAHNDRYCVDLTEEINECLRSDDVRLPSVRLSVVDFRLKWSVGGEGTLVWNLDEDRFEALDLDAPLELEGSFELWREKEKWCTVRFAADGKCTWTMRATER